MRRELICRCGTPFVAARNDAIWCEDCRRANRNRTTLQWRLENRERHLASHRIRNKRWKDANREKIRASGRAYEATRREDPAYREKQRLHALIVRRDNPEHVAEIRKRHYLKHADALRAKAREAKAREDYLSHREARFVIYDRDAGRCHLCGKKVSRDNFHLDHLIPRSKGGVTSPENLAVSHPGCNQRRGAGRVPAQLLLLGS